MDMMAIRRRVLMGSRKKKSPDTTVKIAEYGVAWQNRTQKVENANWGISEFVVFEPVSTQRTLRGYGNVKSFVVSKDGGATTFDYWGTTTDNPWERKCLNENTNACSFSIILSLIDDAWMIIVETGDILFAGKNTPYYGYTNINDMP